MSLSQFDQVRNLSLSHLEFLLELLVYGLVQLSLEPFYQSAGGGLVRLQELADSLEVHTVQVVQAQHQSLLSAQLLQSACEALRHHVAGTLGISFFDRFIRPAMHAI